MFADSFRFLPDYPFCIRLTQKVDSKVLATFNARNEHDRCKFADDLRESIAEMDEMETIRIELELERQLKATRCAGNGMNNNVENRDSGVVGDIEAIQFTSSKSFEAKSASNNDIQSGQLKRGGALSNSLLDIHDQCKKFVMFVHRLELIFLNFSSRQRVPPASRKRRLARLRHVDFVPVHVHPQRVEWQAECGERGAGVCHVRPGRDGCCINSHPASSWADDDAGAGSAPQQCIISIQ